MVWKLFGPSLQEPAHYNDSREASLDNEDEADASGALQLFPSWDSIPTSMAPSSMLSFARGAVGSTVGRFMARFGEKVLGPIENRRLKKEYEAALKVLSSMDSNTWTILKPLIMRSQFVDRLLESTRLSKFCLFGNAYN
jgi:hypothetical protein